VGDVIIGASFQLFDQVYLSLGANPTSHSFGSMFLETRLSSESLEPMVGILAYLEPKLCFKKQNLSKNSNPTKGNFGHFG